MPAIRPATTSTTAIVDAKVSCVEQRDGVWLVPSIDKLSEVPSLNLVCVPDLATLAGEAYLERVASATQAAASRRAFLLVDPPADGGTAENVARTARELREIVGANGALYWPLLVAADGSAVAPSVPVARVIAETDQNRGVWKAPAGIEAFLAGLRPAVIVDETTGGTLNDLSVNVIRNLPRYGTVIWGARTLAYDPDYRYVNVRRTLLFLESSLQEGLKWASVETNGPQLWAAVTRSIETFLAGLWRSGAFMGSKPDAAFFVQCDATTTTQDDIDNGRLNVVVGVAPQRPAEFVIISIQQLLAAP